MAKNETRIGSWRELSETELVSVGGGGNLPPITAVKPIDGASLYTTVIIDGMEVDMPTTTVDHWREHGLPPGLYPRF